MEIKEQVSKHTVSKNEGFCIHYNELNDFIGNTTAVCKPKQNSVREKIQSEEKKISMKNFSPTKKKLLEKSFCWKKIRNPRQSPKFKTKSKNQRQNKKSKTNPRKKFFVEKKMSQMLSQTDNNQSELFRTNH